MITSTTQLVNAVDPVLESFGSRHCSARIAAMNTLRALLSAVLRSGVDRSLPAHGSRVHSRQPGAQKPSLQTHGSASPHAPAHWSSALQGTAKGAL